jgi:hypothetical protein
MGFLGLSNLSQILYGLSDYLAIIYQGIRLRNDNEIK